MATLPPTPPGLCNIVYTYLDTDAVLCEAVESCLKWACPYPLLKGARGQAITLPHHQLTAQQATDLLRTAVGQSAIDQKAAMFLRHLIYRLYMPRTLPNPVFQRTTPLFVALTAG